MSPSSKTSSSPDASSPSQVSPEVAAEIARLMRVPDSMRAEAEQMRRSSGGGHYDPNQPRVPAGDSRAASLRRRDIAAGLLAKTRA